MKGSLSIEATCRPSLRIQLLLLLVCAATPLLLLADRAHAIQPVVLDPDSRRYDIGLHLELLEDARGDLTISRVQEMALADRFSAVHDKIVSIGFSSSAYWFRFTLKNPHPVRRRMMLEISNAQLDLIELYIRLPDGTFSKRTSGDALPHGHKAVRGYTFVFPIHCQPGSQQTIYLRVQTQGAMQVPARLWTPEGFLEHTHVVQLAYGIHFGLMIFMLFYNLFILFTIRDRVYLYYVLFILGVMVYQGSFEGIAQEMLWPSLPWWGNRALPFASLFAALFALLLAKDFLQLKQRLPKWDLVVTVFAWVDAAALVATLILPYRVIIVFVALVASLQPFLPLSAALVSLLKGFKPARLYLAAWIIWLLGIVALGLNRIGVVPRTFLTDNAHLVGFALNAVVLSLALASRINILKQEKEDAQAAALKIQQRAAESLGQEVKKKTADLQKRTEELEDALEHLAEQDRLKSNFFANVSHELRSPLTLILTPIQGLLTSGAEQLSDLARSWFRSMARNTQRLLRLVNQLLDFSRIESGMMEVFYEEVDPRGLAEPVVQAFEPFARGKQLELKLDSPDQLPRVFVDPAKLDKVLCNLLSNACKFTDRGGKVTVRLTSDDSALRIEVQDSGVGIAEKDLPRVFERFMQVDGESHRRHEGTGIGLALSRELVEMMGGKLELSSEPGFGSTFTIELPLGLNHIEDPSMIRKLASSDRSQAGDEVAAAAAALAAEAGQGFGVTDKPEQARATGGPVADQSIPPDSDRPLVVVVEDNPDMRSMVAQICESDFGVLQAEDGQQGLELIRTYRPALVISDVMMPRMDGYEMLGRLRADPTTAGIPVMLLTAKAGTEMRLEGLEIGADDYMPKPFSSRELRARALNLVRLQQKEHELIRLNATLQQRVVSQTSTLELARTASRFLPPQVVQAVMQGQMGLISGQERKQLTVFRLRLHDFARLTVGIKREEVAGMLNGYLTEIVELAFEQGATVDTIIRDEVVGYLGAPLSSGIEEDALRCARAAIGMWHRAVEICYRWRPHLQARVPLPTMVLDSGWATVGSFGSSNRQEYLAIGGPILETRRILDVVEPGEVVCTHRTRRMLHAVMTCEPLADTRPRKDAPVAPLYRLAQPARTPAPPPDETGITPGGIDPRQVADMRPGVIVAGRYEIIRPLEEKVPGAAYLVLDPESGKTSTLYVIRTGSAGDQQRSKRWIQVLSQAARLQYPNVARITEIEEQRDSGELALFAVEHVEGQRLDALLEIEHLPSLDVCLNMLRQLCSGLSAVHTTGLMHGGLNPANIMICGTGKLVILNLGLAQLRGGSVGQSSGRWSGSKASMRYMAPEQFLDGQVDQRTDIYSTGVIAFEMLTGSRPFDGDHASAIAKMHIEEAAPDPRSIRPELPPWLAAVLLRCLAKEPGDRFESASELLTFISVGWNDEVSGK